MLEAEIEAKKSEVEAEWFGLEALTSLAVDNCVVKKGIFKVLKNVLKVQF